MTITEHTALMSARLVSSGAAAQFCAACGPTRSARSGSSSHAGYFGAGPTSDWVSASAVGAAVLDAFGPAGCWCPSWPIAASMPGRYSQLVR